MDLHHSAVFHAEWSFAIHVYIVQIVHILFVNLSNISRFTQFLLDAAKKVRYNIYRLFHETEKEVETNRSLYFNREVIFNSIVFVRSNLI